MGSTISTLLHDKINPKDCQVLSRGDSGFLQLFRVVSSDYGKPRNTAPFFLSAGEANRQMPNPTIPRWLNFLRFLQVAISYGQPRDWTRHRKCFFKSCKM